MHLSYQSLLTILGMTLATYLTRAGGLWLVGRITPSPRVEAWLRHIPGAVLISIVTPVALTSGVADMLATVATAFVAWRTQNLILTMILGVGMVLLLRSFI